MRGALNAFKFHLLPSMRPNDRIHLMNLMVVEKFLSGGPEEVGARFRKKGRMLPPGVAYLDSWMFADGTGCFQLMEAESVEALRPWVEAWSDLVDFEMTPVVDSKAFWSAQS